MKKLKTIAAAIVRAALLLSPGIAFAVWCWPMLDPLINILAAVGLETLFLLVFMFISVTVQAFKLQKAEKAAALENAEIEGTTPEVE